MNKRSRSIKLLYFLGLCCGFSLHPGGNPDANQLNPGHFMAVDKPEKQINRGDNDCSQPGRLHDYLQHRWHAHGQSRLQYLQRQLYAGKRLQHHAGGLQHGFLWGRIPWTNNI